MKIKVKSIVNDLDSKHLCIGDKPLVEFSNIFIPLIVDRTLLA